MPFEHSKKRVWGELGLLLLVLGLLGLGAWTGLRKFAAWGAPRVPLAVDKKLGDLLAKSFTTSETPCNSPGAQAAVEQVTRHLSQSAGPGLVEIHVTVLSNPQPNAFALPGGHVFVFSGLLKEAKSVDELAGVLAHELGHVARRHHVQRALQEAGLIVALTSLFGDVDVLTGTILGGSSELLSKSFSRSHEEDADLFALKLMRKAGYRTDALGGFLERLESMPAMPSFLRTHPTGEDRSKRLRDLTPEQNKTPAEQNAPVIDLDVLKSACS